MTERELKEQLTRDARWLQKLRERVEQLRSGLEYPSISRTTPVQGGSGADRYSDTFCEIIRLEGEIEHLSAYMLNEYFSLLEDDLSVRVMEYRYLQWMTWDAVAKYVGYSVSHCKRVHSSAMIRITKKVSTLGETLA